MPPRLLHRPAAPRHPCRAGCLPWHLVALWLAPIAFATPAVTAAHAAAAEPSATPTASAATAPSRGTTQAAFAEQVLAVVNQTRAQQGLNAWQADDALTAIAQGHSRLMAQRARLGHDGFDGRFRQARSQRCVETLAAGFSEAEALVGAWRLSPTHHANLLEPRARRAGVAAVDGYVTLLACD